MSILPKGTGWSQLPHFIIDHHLSELRGSEIMVLLAICRKTLGYGSINMKPIALSLFVEITGLQRKTVIDAIESLREKNIIVKNTDSTPYEYGLMVPDPTDTHPQKQQKYNHSRSSKNTPQKVQKVNRSGVQKLNPQKKDSKDNKRNTTSSSMMISEDMWEVINYWNSIFPGTLNTSDTKSVKEVEGALKKFSVEKLKRAIFIRSNASFYRDRYPGLRARPSSFFGYHETIENDANRKMDGIYTYEEMVSRVSSTADTTDNYEMIDFQDEKGRPMWRKK